MGDERHWSRRQDALRRLLAAGRAGVISDFDGTLSPFVTRAPDAAIVPASAAALDRLLARGVPVALVSGRDVADLRGRFAREGVRYYGNHGLERWDQGSAAPVPEARPWRAPLAAALADLGPSPAAGCWVEDKGVTAAVHYRAAPDPVAAATQLAATLAPLCARHGLRLHPGNGVWELRPPLGLDKGTALRAIVAEQNLDAALFLGDDRTDLAAMAALRALRDAGALRAALAVGVLHPAGSPPELRDACDLTADGVDDVARLLTWLADAAEGCDTGEEGTEWSTTTS